MGSIDLERKLDEVTVQDEIAGHEMSIAQKKAVAREMKKKYGRDWKKMLSIKGDVRQEMAALGHTYRDLNTPHIRKV